MHFTRYWRDSIGPEITPCWPTEHAWWERSVKEPLGGQTLLGCYDCINETKNLCEKTENFTLCVKDNDTTKKRENIKIVVL